MTPSESRKSLLSLFFAPELRAWRGRMPLAVVFWGYGVATSMALVILPVSYTHLTLPTIYPV